MQIYEIRKKLIKSRIKLLKIFAMTIFTNLFSFLLNMPMKKNKLRPRISNGSFRITNNFIQFVILYWEYIGMHKWLSLFRFSILVFKNTLASHCTDDCYKYFKSHYIRYMCRCSKYHWSIHHYFCE